MAGKENPRDGWPNLKHRAHDAAYLPVPRFTPLISNDLDYAGRAVRNSLARHCPIRDAGSLGRSGSSSYLGAKLLATANAARSSVSRAIFWASITSPATR
jgi:hypothetical protein